MKRKKCYTSALETLNNQPQLLENLFDHLPDIVFFIKNIEGKYQVVNQSLVDRCGLSKKSEVIDATPSSVLGEKLGFRYEEQDKEVMLSGKPMLRHLELHNYQSQEIGWCLTTKIPLYNESKQCIGLIGVSQDMQWPDITDHNLKGVTAALTYAQTNLDKNPSIIQMAKIANMSSYQLDRRMKLVFGVTTGKWLIQTKISKASRELIETNKSILDIALASGYNDQSAFSRQFKKATGQTPSEFQKRNK